jgi:hypothetical protein
LLLDRLRNFRLGKVHLWLTNRGGRRRHCGGEAALMISDALSGDDNHISTGTSAPAYQHWHISIGLTGKTP